MWKKAALEKECEGKKRRKRKKSCRPRRSSVDSRSALTPAPAPTPTPTPPPPHPPTPGPREPRCRARHTRYAFYSLIFLSFCRPPFASSSYANPLASPRPRPRIRLFFTLQIEFFRTIFVLRQLQPPLRPFPPLFRFCSLVNTEFAKRSA